MIHGSKAASSWIRELMLTQHDGDRRKASRIPSNLDTSQIIIPDTLFSLVPIESFGHMRA